MSSEHTKKQFDALKEGITRDQVEEQFGDPAQSGIAPEGGTTVIYEVSGGDYYLRYKDDFRSTLVQKGFNPGSIEKAGNWVLMGYLRGLIIMVVVLAALFIFVLIASHSQ